MKKIVIILLVIISLNSSAQDSTLFNNIKKKIGLSFGTTNSVLDETVLNIKYYYKATFIQLQWYHAIHAKKNWGIDLIFQPQFNFVRYKPIDDELRINKGFEFGLNGGFVFRRNYLNNKISLYGLISSGPHFTSGTPARQVKGFLFSNNFDLGINLKIYKKLYFDVRPGFRHISNANLNRPNGGINTFTMNLGFFILY